MKKKLFKCLAIVAPLCLIGNIQAQNNEPKAFKESNHYLHLKSKIDEENTVRVIVKTKPIYPLKTNKGQQRASAKLLDEKLTEKNIFPRKKLKSGLRVYEVNLEELEELLQDDYIESVVEDKLSKPLLDTSVPYIKANDAHSYGYSGSGQTVVILDTGVDSSHPDFGGRVIDEACFSTNDITASSLCPNDLESQIGNGSGQHCDTSINGCDHGTHVAGIAAGVNGVAPQANIIAVQVFSEFPSTNRSCKGQTCVLSYASNQAEALQWVIDNASTYDIASINMSLGGTKQDGSGYTEFCNTGPLKPYIDELVELGIATVIAAGNNGWSDAVTSPGCIESAITVGNIYDDSHFSSWINAASYSTNLASMVDILAPGSGITSTIPDGKTSIKSGTSMAAPHIAGAIAVFKSSNSTASVSTINTAMKDTGITVSKKRILNTDASGLIIGDIPNALTLPRIDTYNALLSIERKPIARIDQSSYSIIIGNSQQFTANGSNDHNNRPLTFNWNFDDGSADYQTSQPSVDYNYADIGTYTLSLSTDNGNTSSGTVSATVTVYDPVTIVTTIITPLLLM